MTTARPSRRECFSVLDGGRLSLRVGAATELVSTDKIVFAWSSGNNTNISTSAGEYSVRAPLRVFVDALRGYGFLRVRRGALVNIARVQRLVGRGQHRLTMILDTGLEIQVGREFQRAVRVRFGARTRR